MTESVHMTGSKLSESGAATVFKDTVLLVVTEAETEAYIPEIRENLDLLWPGHPDCVVATDGALKDDATLTFQNVTFLQKLDKAVRRIQKDRPETRHIFLMRDVFCPLGPVDTRMLETAMGEVQAQDLEFVLFQWPGNFESYLDSDVAPPVVADGVDLQAMQQNRDGINSLAPAIWDINHLLSVIDAKMGAWIHDADRFPNPVPVAAVHYMQQDGWPTLYGGFLIDGVANPKAITRSYFPASPLASKLRVEYCGQDDLNKARKKYGLAKATRGLSKKAKHSKALKDAPQWTPEDGAAEVFKNTILLVLSQADNEKYIPAVRETLDRFWPGHPNCVFAHGGESEGTGVPDDLEETFLQRLDGAVQRIRKEHPDTRHVFLLPNEFCPLGQVDTLMLQTAMTKVLDQDLQFVLFQWPGDFRIALDSEVAPSVVAGNLELTAMRPYWETINAVAPAIWGIDHLQWVIDTKKEAWIHDIRRFQHPLPESPAVHYMQLNGWPTLDGGFLIDGEVNPKAVTRTYFPQSSLMTQLREDYCGADDLRKARKKYGLAKVTRRFSKAAERRKMMKQITKRAPEDGPAEAFKDTVLLVSTYSRNEHYIPAILKTLDMFWPGHPECVVATDGDLDVPGVIRFKDKTFVELLLATARKIKEDRPSTRHIFLMLEDLCPLAPVDTEVVETAMKKVRENDLKYALFPWPGDFSWTFDRTSAPTIIGPDVELAPMQKDWDAPNSLVTAIWNIDHLIWMAERKLEAGVNDPWGFEHQLEENPHTHYMQLNGWPTVQDGFFVRGKLNHLAVTQTGFPPSPIASQLRKEYCGVDNLQIARLKYGLTAFSGHVKARKERKRGLNAKAPETAKPAGDL
ncbi:hypothetical protein [Ruegeria meonggei]|uniref:Uncharacterized protein n=1 Tax=Ruegeria meonggei TaxID=1446476 RepID=A0A1X6ZPQ7_9RHOB|nr:hypothetical protein [Ruegeria meonggei]SLN57721.1 hypothetical protein RUM8411_02792 [Ruegeria meonggei]